MSENGTSRRQVVGALASGAVAAIGSPVLTQQAVAAIDPVRAAKLENPVSQYPHPPFPKQEQPWPGLASKMTPRPDHGEESYKGSAAWLGERHS